MKGLVSVVVICLTIIAPLTVAEDEQRDFYAEPGHNPFKSSLGQDITENIDPFSGNIHLSYVDIKVPGNGGLDIVVQRHYNTPQSQPSYGNPFGFGWTIHFGRLTIGTGNVSQLCDIAADPNLSPTSDNPSIEMPDGGRELLVHSSVLNDGTYISKTNWKAECINPADYTEGVIATAPNGTKYYMREYMYMQGEDGSAGEPAPVLKTWLTNRIEDTYGNTIDISYLEIASGLKLPTLIDASDGRQVTLNYVDPADQPVTVASTNARLSSIVSNNQTWQYSYQPIGEVAAQWDLIQHYKLTTVTRPDGTTWGYEYGTTVNEPGHNRLEKVVYPFGGEVEYTYQWFIPYIPENEFVVRAIETKSQINPGQPTGTWTYEFNPGSVTFDDLDIGPFPENSGRLADHTRITTPVGIEDLYHVGYYAQVNRLGVLWTTGLKLIHRYYEVDSGNQTAELVRTVSNNWQGRVISQEQFRQGLLDDVWDDDVYTPVLATKLESVGGFQFRTDYGNYDAFGNAQTITEYSIYPSLNDNRITQKTYLNDTADWFIGLPETETIYEGSTSVGTKSKTYNAEGRLESKSDFGVTTGYTYTLEGDLASTTNARNHTTYFSNYLRGVPQLEQYPDTTQISRVVNPTGTIASETSGRGHTTSFSYDDLNRLTQIDYPVGNDVSITWNATNKVLTRGAYKETIAWDGFGRELQSTREDTALSSAYTQTYGYDELGRQTFASDINSSLGTTTTFDALDRPIRITNADGTYRSIVYTSAYQETHIDEENNQTTKYFQIIGMPESRSLFYVQSPEGTITQVMRDVLGNLEWSFQGYPNPEDPATTLGWARTYHYNNRLQLASIVSNADIGTTTFGRDILGNMTSKQVETSNITYFTYDERNRLSTIDYVDDSMDVTQTYDNDGNPSTIANGYAIRSFAYDPNGNLTNEDLTIGSNVYNIGYAIDGLDHRSVITYPSGRTLSLSPDALGRPTQAMPYVSGVSYHPDGSVHQVDHTNGQSTVYSQNVRNWVATVNITGLKNLSYGYDNVGNITSITDSLNATSNRSMSYDGLNRLTAVSGSWGSSIYDYDPLNNLTKKSDPANGNRTLNLSYNGGYLNKLVYGTGLLERWFTYDVYGNIRFSDDVVIDPISGAPSAVRTSRQQVFDDASNLIYATRTYEDGLGNVEPLKSGTFSSEYDGTNQRVRKINHSDNNKTTDYIYTSDGLLLGEYDDSGVAYGNEYFYANRLKLATAKLNVSPSVDAGDDLTAPGNSVIQLTGTVADPDGSVSSTLWSQLSGSTVAIGSPSSLSTNVTLPDVSENQSVVLRLTATDDKGDTQNDTITITVNPDTGDNDPPLAEAGPNQTVAEGIAVSLNGSGSSDSDGTIVSYSWQQTQGTTVSLIDASTSTASFTSPDVSQDETLVFELTVTDDDGSTGTDTTQVTVTDAANQPPVANAGPDQSVIEGNVVTLNGNGSTDPDGSVSSYAWVQISGPAVALSSSSSISPTFTAPDVSQSTNLVFELTVTDNNGANHADSVIVTVDDTPQGNQPPVAVINVASTTVSEFEAVQLDGQGSYDPDGTIVSYLWEQISGPSVLLVGAASDTASFQAPNVASDQSLLFELTVTDDGDLVDMKTIKIVVESTPDTTAPVTTFSSTRQKVQGKWQHTISLTRNEYPVTTYFRFSGQGDITSGGSNNSSWQMYSSNVVVHLDKNGTGTFEYYSEDQAGNVEVTKSETLQ